MVRILPSIASLFLGLASLAIHGVQADPAYDVIIVGSGPGGMVAAEYLSRDPKVSVLILEAGYPSMQATGGLAVPSYAASKGWTQFDILGEFNNLLFNDTNHMYPGLILGKTVGGSSSLNGGQYFRPPDSYMINSKWPFPPQRVNALMDEQLKIFKASDNPSADGKYYLQEGYNVVATAFKKIGYREATINDPIARNNKHKIYGHTPYTVNKGLRDSPAKTYWSLMKTRKNVKLVTLAMVDYIKQFKGKAVGVVYNTNNEVQLTSRGAIIMGSGALGTPKVLIQSGVGPKSQLELLKPMAGFSGIKATANGGWVINENVGKHLFDTNGVFASFTHPDMRSFDFYTPSTEVLNQFVTTQSGPYSSPGLMMIGYENIAVNGRNYECQLSLLTGGFGPFGNQSYTTTLYVNNPEGRDVSEFNASGVYIPVNTTKLQFTTPNDLQAMQLWTQRVIKTLNATGSTFVMADSDTASINKWVSQNNGNSHNHFGGTCYTSSDRNDPNRCADNNLRVLGTSNIFIGDASAMRDGTVGPYCFVMYIGREVGDQVKAFLDKY